MNANNRDSSAICNRHAISALYVAPLPDERRLLGCASSSAQYRHTVLSPPVICCSVIYHLQSRKYVCAQCEYTWHLQNYEYRAELLTGVPGPARNPRAETANERQGLDEPRPPSARESRRNSIGRYRNGSPPGPVLGRMGMGEGEVGMGWVRLGSGGLEVELQHRQPRSLWLVSRDLSGAVP